MNLRILRDPSLRAQAPDDPTLRIATLDEVKSWVRSGSLLRHVGRYDRVTLAVRRLDPLVRPFVVAVLLRALSRGRCEVEDPSGERRSIGLATIARTGLDWARDRVSSRALLRAVERAVADLERHVPAPKPPPPSAGSIPAYLYACATPWEGLVTGGSAAHVSGVLNELARRFGGAEFLTCESFPGLSSEVRTRSLSFGDRFWDVPELRGYALSASLVEEVSRALAGRSIRFLYHRHTGGVYAAPVVARRLGIPLIVEYNGSEVWIAANWAKHLRHEELAVRVERANLRAADLVVVVSEVLREELLALGVEERRIVVRPNGVDPNRYSPSIDGAAVRRRHGLGDATVVGFIGTFGPWHGAEVLAEAFGRLLAAAPHLRGATRLLMIGDGSRMAQVREALARHGVTGAAVLTGLVPQEEGAAHLAACDVLVSPHVPNPDGSRFFGSPTKLFEYMAMGKGIVASRLEQIGDVLEHDRTAWLTTPGDADSLASGIRALVEDPALRDRLGEAARRVCLERYTWERHVAGILGALGEL